MRDVQLGQLVYSIAGRDKGQLYVVLNIMEQEARVLLANGKSRKVDNPKLKNVKHLKKTNIINESIKKKLERGKKPSDTDIKTFIEESVQSLEGKLA